MDGSVAKGLGTAILALLIIVFLIAGFGGWFLGKKIWKRDYIKSESPIIPEIRLTTDGKIVDTLFIYHKPK